MNDLKGLSAEPLFWMMLFALGFVMGALNGIILLTLRRWRYEEAGDRWAAAFWLGLFWAPLTFAIARLPLTWWWRASLTQLTTQGAYGLVALWLILNALGVWRLGVWASRE